MNVNTTTKVFPRTLREAFPEDPDYASSIEVYRKTFRMDVFNFWLLIFALGVLCGALLTKI